MGTFGMPKHCWRGYQWQEYIFRALQEEAEVRVWALSEIGQLNTTDAHFGYEDALACLIIISWFHPCPCSQQLAQIAHIVHTCSLFYLKKGFQFLREVDGDSDSSGPKNMRKQIFCRWSHCFASWGPEPPPWNMYNVRTRCWRMLCKCFKDSNKATSKNWIWSFRHASVIALQASKIRRWVSDLSSFQTTGIWPERREDCNGSNRR